VTGLPTDMGGARAKVRRKPERARYDAAAVHAVLDAAPFCHVATVRDGRPVALPMVHARSGGTLVLHGSAAAGLFRDMRRASPVCVTATLFDGLVLARSARNHSVNYRSVTVHGDATLVTDPDEVLLGMRALIEHVAPGRWEQVRRPEPDELRDTALWQVPIEEASAKARSGTTIDPESDFGWPVWAGHIPARLVFGAPVPADHLPGGVDPAGSDVVLNSAFGDVSPVAEGAGRPG
jgi:nitroimidazol reductase NimA-like FMN-containing flavoprotein (pyridoxamine 5'-phosphate oxidase superfamily)